MWVGFKDGDGNHLQDFDLLWSGVTTQGKMRGDELNASFEAAKAAGAVYCGIKNHRTSPEVICRGSLEDCKAFIIEQEMLKDEEALGYLQCVLGTDMWGEDVGSQTTSMFPARDGHTLSIMTVEPPDLSEAPPDIQRRYAVSLRTRHCDADVILPKGNKILIGYMTGGWMGVFENYDLDPTHKLGKRIASILLKGFQFTAEVSRDQVVVKYIEDLDLKDFEECQVDGHVLVHTGWAIEHILTKKGVTLSIERGMKKLREAYGGEDKIPEKAIQLLREMAARRREDLVRRALKNNIGSFRALDPDDAMKKGNASLVPDLWERFGCHILTSRANCKSDIKGKGLPEMKWLFGFDSKPAHFGASASNTSGQSIGAHQQLFPQEQVKGWIRNEVNWTTQLLVSGQLEEDYKEAAEISKRLQDDLGEEVHGVLFTFRTAMENLLNAGRGFLDFRFAPYLCLDTFDALSRRMADPARARISVPVPHSLSCSIMSERLARLAGWQGPEIPEDRIAFWKERSMMIFSNTGLKKKLRNLGGADFDDDAHAYLFRDSDSGELRIAVIRYPTDRGEYLVLKPLREKEDVEIFQARPTLKMKFNSKDAVFTFTKEETPIREVSLKAFPPQITTRIESGDLVEVEVPELQGKHQFPDGYTVEAALGLIQKQAVGHQPGRAINHRSGVGAMCGMDPKAAKVLEPKISYASMEGIIDLMTQGGSLEAQAEMERLTEVGSRELLTKLMDDPSLPRIDRVYAKAKPIFLADWAPKELKEFIKREGHLAPPGEGWISPLFKLHEELTAEAKGNLVRWCLVWQQQAPELVSYLSPEEKDPKKKEKMLDKALLHCVKAKDAYMSHVHGLWLAMDDEGKKTKGKVKTPQEKRSLEAARTRYVEAFSTMVQANHLGALFIPMRIIKGGLEHPGLWYDRPLWNGVLSDLVVKYYQGVLDEKGKEKDEGCEERHRRRMPKLADCLSFRLIHMDVECLTRWVQQLGAQSEKMFDYAKKCLWSLVDGTEFFTQEITRTVKAAFTEDELRAFQAYACKKSGLKDTPLSLRLRLVAGLKDKAREVLTEIARQEHEKFKDEDGGDDWSGNIPSTPTPPPAPPAPAAAEDWVKETEVARDVDALEKMRVQEEETQRILQENLALYIQDLKDKVKEVVAAAKEGKEHPDFETECCYDNELFMEALKKGWIEDPVRVFSCYWQDMAVGAEEDGVKDEFLDGVEAAVLDVLKEEGIQVGVAPASVEELPVSEEAESLGARLKALHQELDQAVLEYELAPDAKFQKLPSDWVRWLKHRLGDQVVPDAVLQAMAQASMEWAYREMKYSPSKERLAALEEEIRKHYRMGVRGESDGDFEVAEEYQEEFTSGNAEMITDIQGGIVGDWWAAYAFNHNIADEIVMPIADRIYKEVVAEYQASLKKPEAVTVQEVSLQEAEEMTWSEEMRKIQWGPGVEKWSNGEVTMLLVRDRAKAVEWFRSLSTQKKEEFMANVTHKTGESK